MFYLILINVITGAFLVPVIPYTNQPIEGNETFR